MSRDQSSTAKIARDNDNRKSGDKPKRHGNHNQGGNRNNIFRCRANKQSKAILTLDPASEPTKITSVDILDEMDKAVKEKLPNNRDDDNGALLVKLCQKVIAVFATYKLYNKNVGRDDDGHSDGPGGDGKDTNMCRTPDHNHAWKDCPDNRWSRNYEGPSSRSRGGNDDSRSRSRSPPRRGAWHHDRDHDQNEDRDKGRDRVQNCNRAHPRQAVKVCEAHGSFACTIYSERMSEIIARLSQKYDFNLVIT